MNDTGLSNRDFIERHAAPGRIGLCTGSEWMSRWIRKAQAPLTDDGHRSLWSHAFIFNEQRVDGHWWVVESDLDVRYKQIRLGVQENRVSRYYDAESTPNLAILDLGLSAEQARSVQIAALELLSGLSHYSISELIGTVLSMPSTRLRRRKHLMEQSGALFCSAFVHHCFGNAGVPLLPELHNKHVTPHDLATSPQVRQQHRLIRDLGVSHLRQFTGEVETLAEEWLP